MVDLQITDFQIVYYTTVEMNNGHHYNDTVGCSFMSKKALAQDRCTSNFLNQMIKILLPRLAVLVRANQLSFKQAEWRRCLDCFSGVSV